MGNLATGSCRDCVSFINEFDVTEEGLKWYKCKASAWSNYHIPAPVRSYNRIEGKCGAFEKPKQLSLF